MKSGEDSLSYRPLYIKDQALLKDFNSAYFAWTSYGERLNFLRAWQELYKRGSVLLVEGKGLRLLLLIQTADSLYFQRRVLLIPSRSAVQPELLQDLVEELFQLLFKAEPLAYDFRLIFPQNFKFIGHFSLPAHVKQSGNTTFYTTRFQSRAHVNFLLWRGTALIFGCSEEEDCVTSLRFMSSGERANSTEDIFLLKAVHCLDENLCFSSQGFAKERKELNLPPILLEAEKQLEEYLRAERQSFELNFQVQGGSEFQRAVWQAISRIPYGNAKSYSDIAREVAGEQKARYYARAVGKACSQNPLAIFIPCHRVIGEKGDLTGFSGGLNVKNDLLNLEILQYKSLD